jgi:hypothetical protein
LCLLVFCLSGVLALSVHFDSGGPEWPYPGPGQVDEKYESMVGDEVFLYGTVIRESSTDRQFVFQVTHSVGAYELTVEGSTTAIPEGGFVQVYGTLREGRTVAADGVVVVNRTPAHHQYKLIVSGFAAVLLVGLFFKHWWIDPEKLGFVPR